VTWYKGNEMITDDDDFRTKESGDNYRLHIAEVFPDDSGVYRVVAENKSGRITSYFTLDVYGAVRFVSILKAGSSCF